MDTFLINEELFPIYQVNTEICEREQQYGRQKGEDRNFEFHCTVKFIYLQNF